ncbi:MAG TPA: RodZ domain-containing protein [Sphingomicrobium sp.]|jgi:cytoskeletal protein RodZ|nr:RodZ domain-containing protein [Sphingomicrobium sp.]
MDEDLVQTDVPTVGERLRAAREEKGLTLDDVAAQTRIPRRHLESIEKADWDALPAPTYTTGFAKSYASAVGLDRTDIGDQLRAEMGGQRFATTAEVFEAADPARTMPKSLVIGALVAVIVLIALMSWLNSRSLETPEQANTNAPAPAAAAPAQTPQAAAPAPAQAAQGPVVLTATDAVWLQVSEKGGPTLFSGTLQPGQTFAVPPSAAAPVLKTGKPEALRINIGNTVAPPVGPPATTVSNVSLLPADLLKGGRAATTAGQTAPAAPKPRPRVRPPAATAPAPAPTPKTAPPPTTNTAE